MIASNFYTFYTIEPSSSLSPRAQSHDRLHTVCFNLCASDHNINSAEVELFELQNLLLVNNAARLSYDLRASNARQYHK